MVATKARLTINGEGCCFESNGDEDIFAHLIIIKDERATEGEIVLEGLGAIDDIGLEPISAIVDSGDNVTVGFGDVFVLFRQSRLNKLLVPCIVDIGYASAVESTLKFVP